MTNESRTVAARVDKITREISGVASQYGIDSWEQDFLTSIATRHSLTPRQETRLREVEVKVFGEDYDPHTKELF